MRDDERYPIPMAPEGQVFVNEEKIAMASIYRSDSTVTSSTRNALATPITPVAAPPNYYRTAAYQETPLPMRQAKQPWWKNRTILLLLILIVLMVGAITAGIVYAASRRAHSGQLGNGTGSKEKEVVANSTRDSMASSGLFLNDGKTWNMQTYWQDSQGGIKFQMSLDGQNFKNTNNMSLSIPAKMGSPLSATASTDTSGVVYLTLFYLTMSSEIAMANSACAAASTSCKLFSNNVISKLLTVPHANNTGLAAVNVDNIQDWRVFYHDINGQLSQLQGKTSGFNAGELIGGVALSGSSIAAVNVNSTINNINIFYVDAETGDLNTLEFIGDWTVPVPVGDSNFFFWNPLAGLTACYSRLQDQLHVYYTSKDAMVYEYTGSNVSLATTNWTRTPSTQKVWTPANYGGASVTAVGWNDQVRFFQLNSKRMAQASLSKTTWTEAFIGAAT